QTSSCDKLDLIAYRHVSSTDVHSMESRIHEILASYRMRGEWFSCDLETAKAAMSCIRLDYGAPEKIYAAALGRKQQNLASRQGRRAWLRAQDATVHRAGAKTNSARGLHRQKSSNLLESNSA